MTNVVSISGGGAIETDVPTSLRKIADEIERGERGAVDRVFLVLESAGLVQALYVGKPCLTLHAVGAMHTAAFMTLSAGDFGK